MKLFSTSAENFDIPNHDQFLIFSFQNSSLDENTSPTLAFALGNRSAALFRLENYSEAITDIHFALSLNYPKASRSKLYERIGRCYLAKEDGIKAKTAFNICKQLLNEDEKAIKNIESLIEKADRTQPINSSR